MKADSTIAPFTQSKIIVKLKGIDSMEWIQLWGISTLVICIAGAFLIKFI